MVLVANPLHYKRLITKRRLHIAFLSIYIFVSINIACFLTFLRQGTFIISKECVVQYIVQSIPYFVQLVFIYTCIVTMAVNGIIITIKLQKMKRVALGTKTDTQDNDQKLTQATWMALKLFLPFVVPVTFLGAVSPFLEQPYPMSYDVLLDISYILFYMNNVVNPFVYYVFLKDFKEGYQVMLCCKKNSGNTNRSTVGCSGHVPLQISCIVELWVKCLQIHIIFCTSPVVTSCLKHSFDDEKQRFEDGKQSFMIF